MFVFCCGGIRFAQFTNFLENCFRTGPSFDVVLDRARER